MITREIFATLADLPLNKAAAAGVSPAPFKKACRKLGVRRWAYKRSRSAQAISAALSGALALGGKDAGLESCSASIKSEIESGPEVAPATQTPTFFYPADAGCEPETNGLGSVRRDSWARLCDDVCEVGAAQKPEMPAPLLVARPLLPSHSSAQPARRSGRRRLRPAGCGPKAATGVRARRRRPSGSFSRRRRWTKPWCARCWICPGLTRREATGRRLRGTARCSGKR